MSDAGLSSIGYVILSEGARHTMRPLRERPGAAAQMRAIEAFSQQLSHRNVFWLFDYARAPEGPADFQVLKEILLSLERREAGSILIDGAERLFRRLSGDELEQMYSLLERHRGRIFDIRRARLLSRLSDKEWFAVGYSGLFKQQRAPRISSTDHAPKDTAKARHVSKLARGKNADVVARAVLNLRTELTCRGSMPSNLALAREANVRGLRTTRGKEWSGVAIGRALKRLADGGTE